MLGKPTLAVAGTRDTKDVLTDLSYALHMESFVPGNRFEVAKQAWLPGDRVIGHSLGAAVAAQFPGETVGYNSYALPYRSQPKRNVRHRGDPFSTFANDPEMVGLPVLNAHSLSNLA